MDTKKSPEKNPDRKNSNESQKESSTNKKEQNIKNQGSAKRL